MNWRPALGATVLIIAFCNSILGASSIPNRDVLIPEYFKKPAWTICVRQVAPKSNSRAARQAQVTQYLSEMYDISGGWRSAVIPIGVDYVAFRSFLIVTFLKCGDDIKQHPALFAIFKPDDVKITQVTDTPFISDSSIRAENRSATALFFRRRTLREHRAAPATRETPRPK